MASLFVPLSAGLPAPCHDSGPDVVNSRLSWDLGGKPHEWLVDGRIGRDRRPAAELVALGALGSLESDGSRIRPASSVPLETNGVVRGLRGMPRERGTVGTC